MDIIDFNKIYCESNNGNDDSYDNNKNNLIDLFDKNCSMVEYADVNLTFLEATDVLCDLSRNKYISKDIKDLTIKYLDDFTKLMRKKESESKNK